MKKNYKYICVICCIILGIQTIYAEPKSLSDKQYYPLYKERVKYFCDEYKNTDTSSEIIYTIDESKYFVDLDKKSGTKGLENAVKSYRKNMDSIYACATSVSYKRVLKTIKEQLIAKNPKINSRIRSKIEKKERELEQKVNKLEGNCKINSDQKSNIIKKSILKQTTYETCKYNFYLEYLKEINHKIKNVYTSEGSVSIKKVVASFQEKQGRIEKEVEKSYRAFPLVYEAYSDFENNIGSHILLELIREDYYILREELHKTLNPINQVVYKISNAMRP